MTKKFVRNDARDFKEFYVSFRKFHEHFSLKTSKILSNLGSEKLTGALKMQRMAATLIRSERYHKYGNDVLNHIARVTGLCHRLSVVNVKTLDIYIVIFLERYRNYDSGVLNHIIGITSLSHLVSFLNVETKMVVKTVDVQTL
jgi:hypothetical protein